jgi:hypothetical protein
MSEWWRTVLCQNIPTVIDFLDLITGPSAPVVHHQAEAEGMISVVGFFEAR